MQSLPLNSATLFIGDLSIFCTEKELYQLFEPFGPIESIQLKRCEKKQMQLSYGFIKFAFRQSAEEALQTVNGSIFIGRAIRVGWALDNPAMKSPEMRQRESKNIKQTAQIHVAFNSYNPSEPVTEMTLRNIFSHFGDVVDVTINKTLFSQEHRNQTGYGFVHYRLHDEGISSALMAISSVNGNTINRVTYECRVSHGLENYLNSRTNPSPRHDDRSMISAPTTVASLSRSSSGGSSYRPVPNTLFQPMEDDMYRGHRYPQRRQQQFYPPADANAYRLPRAEFDSFPRRLPAGHGSRILKMSRSENGLNVVSPVFRTAPFMNEGQLFSTYSNSSLDLTSLHEIEPSDEFYHNQKQEEVEEEKFVANDGSSPSQYSDFNWNSPW